MNNTIIINLNTSWNIFNFRLDLIELLQSEGFEVIAVAPSDSYVSKLESLGVTCYHVSLNPKGINPFKELSLIYKYYNLFKELKPDVILSYTIKPNIYGNFAAYFANIPTINNISGLGTLFIKKSLTTNIVKKLYKLSLSSSRHVFFQNNDDKLFFTNNKLVEPNTTSIIPGSGVNVNKFSCNRTKNEGNKFLFVGRLISDKGVFEYLEAAVLVLKKYPQKEFLLVGELGYKNKTALNEEQLMYFTDNYPQIKYLGKTDDIVSLLNSVDVVVLPSYREGLPKSLIEAAAMNLPIITTNVPGCRDVVDNEFNGLLCKLKSTNSLKNAIFRLISLTEKERLNFGVNGRKKIINKFSSEIVNKIYVDKINGIINVNNAI